MFEGYSGRRRLKTLIISIIVSLIFLVLISNRKTNVKRLHRRKQVPIQTLNALQTPVTNILSSIEFTNSPHFNSESHSSNTIPIIVLSKASNIEVRDAIRRTWAFNQFYKNDTIDIQVFFLVGTDDYTTNRIRAEQMIFNDVIHVSIPDTNSFLAYKELSAMIWIRTYLPNALFYMKTEEDVIMNINSIVNKLLPVIQSVQHEHIIIGWFGSEHVIRRGRYQAFIDAVISSSSINLNYAMNLLYIVTSKAADRMLDTLTNIEFIELPGDLFVTGLLRDAAHVQIKNLANNMKDYRYEVTNGLCPEEMEKNSKLLLCTSSLHFGLQNSMTEYFDAWNKLLSQ